LNGVTRSVEFDAGHRVPSHGGRCRYPHGHRYRVEISVRGQLTLTGPEQAMVADFGMLKDCLHQVTDRLDHAFLVWDHDDELREVLKGRGWRVVELPMPPTAEALAELLFEGVLPLIVSRWSGRVELERVTVWETPSSSATYSP
jgi:6-pyruvoyltetrahydropterin/6-carboxytetrahydropterin synthase